MAAADDNLANQNEAIEEYLLAVAAEPYRQAELMKEMFERVKTSCGPHGANAAVLLATLTREQRGSMTNINIKNSTVGNVNTGSQIGAINASATSLAGRPDAESKGVADALRQLSDAIQKAPELSDEKKKEALELLASIGQSAEQPKEKRVTGVIKSVVAGLGTVLSVGGTVLEVWKTHGPVISKFFGF